MASPSTKKGTHEGNSSNNNVNYEKLKRSNTSRIEDDDDDHVKGKHRSKSKADKKKGMSTVDRASNRDFDTVKIIILVCPTRC